MEKSFDGEKKDWLVRSSMKILGPYGFEEIINALKNHQVSIIDEVRKSDSNWSYIREHRLFFEIVQHLRAEQDNSSETTLVNKTTTGITKTKTINNARTGLTPILLDDDSTPIPQLRRRNDTVKDITPTLETNSISSGLQSHKTLTSSYGSANDHKVAARLLNKKKWIYGVAGVFICSLLVGTFIYTKVLNKKKIEQQEELQALGRLWSSQGLYTNALDAFHRAKLIAPLSLESDREMAFLYIHEDRPVEARKILEKQLLLEGLNKNDESSVYNGLGMAALKESNRKAASESFEKAIAFNPSNNEAKLNSIILKFDVNKSKNLISEIESLIDKNSDPRLALLMQVLLINTLPNQQFSDLYLKDIADKVEIQLANGHLIRELLAIQFGVLAKKMNDSVRIEKAFEYFFKNIPFSDKEYSINLHIDSRYFERKMHNKDCHNFATVFSNPKGRLIEAMCLMEDGKELEANKIFEEVLREFPGDKYAQSLKVSYLYKEGKSEEALAALDNSLASDVLMGLYVGLQACIEVSDARCAMSFATKIYGKDKLDSFGLYGMAWSLENQKKPLQALEYLSLSLKFDKSFLPAIVMQARIEGTAH